MLKLGILVSGSGTNLQSIIDSINSGYIKGAEITSVVSNKKNAYALERIKKYNIDGKYINPKEFETKNDYCLALREYFMEKEVDLIILAGFLVVLTKEFIDAFPNKILNIHPSLIPSFCGDGYYGLKVHKGVLDRGVKITGATVHIVDSGTDTGPIIMQKAVAVKDDDTEESLQLRVMKEAEWIIYPKVIKLFAENRIKVVDKKVIITN